MLLIKNIIKFWLLATTIFCPFIIFNYLDSNFLLAKQLFFQISILIIFMVAFYFYGFSIFLYHNKLLFFSCTIFIFWCFFSSFLTPNPFVALPKAIFYFCCVLFSLLLKYFCDVKPAIFFVIWLLLVDIIAIISLLQWLNFPIVQQLHPGFYGSVIGNPNLLANLLVSTIMASIGYALSQRSNKQIFFASIFLLCFVLFITGSRGAILALIAGCLFFICLQKQIWKKMLLLFLFIFTLSIFPTFHNRNIWQKENFSTYSSTQERILIWSCCLQTLQRNPWGYGFDQWQPHAWQAKERFIRLPQNKIYQNHADNIFFTHAHCDYLQIILEIGIIGGLLFAWLCFYLLLLAYKKVLAEKTTVNCAHFSAIIVILVHAIVSFPLQTTVGVLSLLLHMYWISPAVCFLQPEASKSLNTLVVLVAIFLCIVLTISCGYSHVIQ